MRQTRPDAEEPIGRVRVEAATEQRGPLAHADDAVAVGLSRVARGRVGNRELQRLSAEGDLDVRAASTVPRGVGQRLLEDPVGRPVDRGCEVPATAVEPDDNGEPGGAMSFGERLEGR